MVQPVTCILWRAADSLLADRQSLCAANGKGARKLIVTGARSNASSAKLGAVASDFQSQLYLALPVFTVPKLVHFNRNHSVKSFRDFSPHFLFNYKGN